MGKIGGMSRPGNLLGVADEEEAGPGITRGKKPPPRKKVVAGRPSPPYTDSGFGADPLRLDSPRTRTLARQGDPLMSLRSTRREFLKQTSLAGAGFWLAGGLSHAGKKEGANDKINFACIGVGGKGSSD